MNIRSMAARILSACLGAALFHTAASADVVKLKRGGELRGVLRSDSSKTDDPVVIETLSGTVIAVDRSEIDTVTKRPLIVEEHDTKARQTPATIEALWSLAEWCREHGLSTQRATHLRKILEIDKDHRSARSALGYSRFDGRWMTMDEWQSTRGLVRYQGKYMTPEEVSLLKEHEQELERERDWYRKVFAWKTWLNGTSVTRKQDALAELTKLTDPDAVSALARYLKNDPNAAMRRLYVRILTQMNGARPAAALAQQALYDADSDIRYAALNGISESQYSAANPGFVRALGDESVEIVRRAADALRRTGGESAIEPLIEALVTTHRYKVRVPDTASTVGFNTNGTFAGGQSVLPPEVEAMLRSGQLPNGVVVNSPLNKRMIRTKVITVKTDHQNREVLAALQRITGQSFGYNRRDWQLWKASTKVGAGVKTP